MEKINFCAVCQSQKLSTLFECKDNVSSAELFTIVQCDDCGFQLTQNRPSEKDAGKYYISDKYVSHVDDKTGIVNTLYRQVRKINLKWKISIINNLSKKGSILDYGCGLGSFLSAAKVDGWKTTGMDISEEARRQVKKRYDIEVLPNEALYQSNPESFEIISLWHVLEHVYELDQTIDGLKNTLKTKGHLLIALPNQQSDDAKRFKSNWDAYDVPRHLWHFNKKSIELLLSRHGLKLVDTKAMIFDAYYVSIRSEMHKGKKLYFISGLLWGFVSHLKALITKEYSSQLYIFQKI